MRRLSRAALVLLLLVAIGSPVPAAQAGQGDADTARTLDRLSEMTGRPEHVLAAADAWVDAGDPATALARYRSVLSSPDASLDERARAQAGADRLAHAAPSRPSPAATPSAPSASPTPSAGATGRAPGLTLHTSIGGPLDVVIEDDRGGRHPCPSGWQASGCTAAVPSGRVKVKVSGRHARTLWLDVDEGGATHELRLLRLSRHTTLQEVGIVLVGIGAGGAVMSPLIALYTGIGGGEAGTALLSTLGVSAALAGVGAGLWLLTPSERYEVLSTREVVESGGAASAAPRRPLIMPGLAISAHGAYVSATLQLP